MLKQCLYICCSAILVLNVWGCSKNGESRRKPPSFSQQRSRALKIQNPNARAMRLLSIAEGQLKAHDPQGASQTAQDAATACEEIEQPSDKGLYYARLADIQGKLNRDDVVKRYLALAEEQVKQVPEPESKAFILNDIAAVKATKLRDRQGAIAILEQCEALSADQDKQIRVAILAPTAATYHKAELHEKSTALMEQVLTIAFSVEDPVSRIQSILEIANWSRRIQDKQRAKQCAELALENSAEISDPYKQSYALVKIADQFLKLGERNQSYAILEKAETIAHQIQEGDLKREALDRIYQAKDDLRGVSSASK